MARPRIHDTGLPTRVFCRRGKYYYVVSGQWLPLGADKDDAVSKAEAMNQLSADARLAAMASARFIADDIRAEIMARDKYACVYCGAESELELDHVIPFQSGGATTKNNLVIACASCNSSKSDATLPDFMARLHKVVERVIEKHLAYT